MADKKLLTLLQEGVAAWNARRPDLFDAAIEVFGDARVVDAKISFGSIDADPDRHDYALGEISNLAASITVKLSIMRHAGDGKRDMQGLRDLLQDYVDRVMAFAHGTER